MIAADVLTLFNTFPTLCKTPVATSARPGLPRGRYQPVMQLFPLALDGGGRLTLAGQFLQRAFQQSAFFKENEVQI